MASLSQRAGLTESVDLHYPYQGVSLSSAEASEIEEEQELFLRTSLIEGFAALEAFEEAKSVSDGMRPVFVEMSRVASQLRSNISYSQGGGHFRAMTTRLAQLMSLISESSSDESITDKEAVFLNFLVGVLRFDLAVRMAVYVLRRMIPDNAELAAMDTMFAVQKGSESIIRGMADSLYYARELPTTYFARYADHHDEFWRVLSVFIEADPNLSAAAQQLASLQGGSVGDGFTTMAQVLHWNGMGGNGEYLRGIPQLDAFLPHAIGYHGQRAVGGHFSARMQFFASLLLPLKEAGFRRLGSAIEELMPEKNKLRVLDVGSGRNAQGVAGAAKYLDDWKWISVTVADVSGAFLREMCEAKEKGECVADNVIINDVRYLDLTGQLLPRFAGEESFDVFSASLVFHQLMDSERGAEKVADVMKFASSVVRPGGLVHLPTVGEAAHLQFPVIPGNLADKEGCVPFNLLTRLKFDEICTDVDGDGNVSLPYPLERLSKKAPTGLQQDKAIYQYALYVLVKVSEDDLRLLCEYQESGRMDECDALMSRYLDVHKIQDRILARVSKLGEAV